jgi:hypothetical protein
MYRKIVLFFVALALASGQGLQISPEKRQAILAYQLTPARADHLLTALAAMTKYVVSLPDYQERVRKSAKMTSAEQLAMFENDPKAMAILKQNNLTARDYLVGVPALRMAVMAAEGADRESVIASSFNLGFAKAHLAELKPKMEAADKAAAQK